MQPHQEKESLDYEQATIWEEAFSLSLFFNMLSRLVIASFIRALIPFGEGNGTPLQYSCLENPMGGAW